MRDVIAPGRDLGHVDREYPRGGKEVGVGGGGGDGDGAGKERGGGEKKQQQQQSLGVAGVEVGAGTVVAKACGLDGGRGCEDCE